MPTYVFCTAPIGAAGSVGASVVAPDLPAAKAALAAAIARIEIKGLPPRGLVCLVDTPSLLAFVRVARAAVADDAFWAEDADEDTDTEGLSDEYP